jgi:hypothetical protein
MQFKVTQNDIHHILNIAILLYEKLALYIISFFKNGKCIKMANLEIFKSKRILKLGCVKTLVKHDFQKM